MAVARSAGPRDFFCLTCKTGDGAPLTVRPGSRALARPLAA